MSTTTPQRMRAIAINQFGGVEVLKEQSLSVPQLAADEVLIRVESAGVAVWDPLEREGGFHQMFGIPPTFPLVIGTEGAGAVAAVGAQVDRFRVGDRVYAATLVNPKGGFYAEFAAVKSDNLSRVPSKLTTEQAAVMSSDAMTGLRGLADMLALKPGESIMIFGAGGGIGHLAVQLAKRMGARVFAVASGTDGVALAQRLGADAAVDGRKDDVVAAARSFATGGLDAALLTAGGDAADRALSAVRDGGRVTYPNGVEPVPKARPGVTATTYDVVIDRAALDRLDRLIEAGPFEVHVAKTFPLARAADAHRMLGEHYVGKLALRIA